MKTVCRDGVLGIVLLLGMAATLRAGDPLDHWFSTGSSLYNRSLYGLGRLPLPPYFALHPPVYYGTRYARPYGVSPFAAPPQVQVPSDYAAVVNQNQGLGDQPINRPSSPAKPGKTAHTASRARVILNPYCRSVSELTADGVETHNPPAVVDAATRVGS